MVAMVVLAHAAQRVLGDPAPLAQRLALALAAAWLASWEAGAALRARGGEPLAGHLLAAVVLGPDVLGVLDAPLVDALAPLGATAWALAALSVSAGAPVSRAPIARGALVVGVVLAWAVVRAPAVSTAAVVASVPIGLLAAAVLAAWARRRARGVVGVAVVTCGLAVAADGAIDPTLVAVLAGLAASGGRAGDALRAQLVWPARLALALAIPLSVSAVPAAVVLALAVISTAPADRP